MAGFEGDRGKDLLGGTNIRELVPYFIEQVCDPLSNPHSQRLLGWISSCAL
jgi:hypothetical protein